MCSLSEHSKRRFHLSSYYYSLLDHPSGSSVLRSHPGNYKNIWVTSPILTIPVNMIRNHWVLATLPFIRRLLPTQFNGNGEMYGSSTSCLGLGYSHSFFSYWAEPAPFHFFYRKDFTLLSPRLNKIWTLIFWRCLSPSVVMNRALRIYWFWKTSVEQGLVKIYPLHISPPGVVKTQRIQEIHNPTWWVWLAEEFRDLLRGFTCAICVSTQH